MSAEDRLRAMPVVVYGETTKLFRAVADVLEFARDHARHDPHLENAFSRLDAVTATPSEQKAGEAE